ncbi:MAG TPA: metal-dependent transcriptional regulator [Spirochaetota bacterium]|nr:metal-dependent transcriptional regulator [Spirochaetota bacterium]
MFNIFTSDIDKLYGNTDLTPNMEDYIEKIAFLSETNRVVRVRDIATVLKIKMPSVTAALNKLKEQGLIDYEKYGYIELTSRGGIIAKRVISRHLCLKEFFFNVLKLPEEKAEDEACRIEHHISPETCKRIHKLLLYYKSDEEKHKDWIRELEDALKQ